MSSPIVSVLMVAYNHEKFIREAIEGVLFQKTKFPIELVIGEDHSTDSTREICIEYFRKNPGEVKILNSVKNLGGMNNFLRCIEECNGKYTAICEGDDYWIDPLKLQKQVDFLDDNSDYALISTNKRVLYGETIFDDLKKPIITGDVIEDLLLCNSISTLTVLVRTEVFKESVRRVHGHAKEKGWHILDYPLWLDLAMRHKIGYLNEVTGVYRFLPESFSHSINPSKGFSFDKWIIDVKEFYYKEYLKRCPFISIDFKFRFKENIFHLKKRLLLDYGFIAKNEVFSLMKTNPLVFLSIVKKKVKKYNQKNAYKI